MRDGMDDKDDKDGRWRWLGMVRGGDGRGRDRRGFLIWFDLI